MDKSQEQVKDFLSILRLDELNSLVGTVTQYLVKEEFREKQDAIKIILQHSPNAKSLLKRKIITREILFKYLSEENVSIHPPHTKDTLIDATLKHWNNYSTSSEHSNKISIENSLKENENKTTEISTYASTPETLEQVQKNTNINKMAVTFAEWFYKIFNENKPIDVEHFWEDCSLKLNLQSGENTSSDIVEKSAEETTKLLYNTKVSHRIFLNPNLLPEGCQGRMDNHGVVLVLACGTIHVDSLCVGVFEQIFALVRDPFVCNNWKIKFSELNLHNQPNTDAIPRLTDNELTGNFLQLKEL